MPGPFSRVHIFPCLRVEVFKFGTGLVGGRPSPPTRFWLRPRMKRMTPLPEQSHVCSEQLGRSAASETPCLTSVQWPRGIDRGPYSANQLSELHFHAGDAE